MGKAFVVHREFERQVAFAYLLRTLGFEVETPVSWDHIYKVLTFESEQYAIIALDDPIDHEGNSGLNAFQLTREANPQNTVFISLGNNTQLAAELRRAGQIVLNDFVIKFGDGELERIKSDLKTLLNNDYGELTKV